MTNREVLSREAGEIRHLLEDLYWEQGLSQYLAAERLGVPQHWVSNVHDPGATGGGIATAAPGRAEARPAKS